MSNVMQQTVDWSLYPLRLMARTFDLMGRTAADAGAAVRESIRPGTRWVDRIMEGGALTSKFAGDTDLGGDDIKVVQSWIASTRPGHEQLYEVHTGIVNYPTDSETYGAMVLARFLRHHPEYDDADLRYLKPHIHVVERYAKEDNPVHHENWRSSNIAEPVLT